MTEEFFWLTPRIIRRRSMDGALPRYAHWCPACIALHDLPDDGFNFDGNKESPSFTPAATAYGPSGSECNYQITSGQIIFGDCDHSLSGKTMALPTIPERATRFMKNVR